MSRILVMALMVFGFGVIAHAQDNPCANDVQTLCPGIEPGDGRVMKCLHDNMAKLSPECKARHDKMKKAMKEVKAACHDDFDKFCADVKAGGGRVQIGRAHV